MLKSSGRTQEDIAKIIPKTAEERRQDAIRITKNIDSIPYLMSNITSLQLRIEALEKERERDKPKKQTYAPRLRV